MKPINHLRKEYTSEGLRRHDLDANPTLQFSQWFDDACRAEILEPNAMILATVSAKGQPTQRTVLLKAYDQGGFIFFTNFGSRKARQISENANVCLLFLWLPLSRQVAITGQAEKLSTVEAMKYFATRPIDSQLGAWASPQSAVIQSRKFLEMKWQEMKQKFADGNIPLPSFWGGFRVRPDTMEFWQGGTNRLHDRFLYTHQSDGAWTIDRLGP